VKNKMPIPSMLGRLRLTWMVGAFAVGILFTYLLAPAPRVVVKFPSPYNAGKVLYRTEDDSCFMYRADAMKCPAGGSSGDEATVKPQPLLLEDFQGAPTRRGSDTAIVRHNTVRIEG
jgi:hypothetical protein